VLKIIRNNLLITIFFLLGCSTFTHIGAYFSDIELFEEEAPVIVSFKPGLRNDSSRLDLSNQKAITVALLPVRSNMGGGLGEEFVTKSLYEKLSQRLNPIKIISSQEVSDLLVDLDLWEDYFEYLNRYHQDSIVDFDELQRLYNPLKVDYIINTNSDFTPIPKYPTSFELYVQIQVWDLKNGKLLWEGFSNGNVVIRAQEETDRLKQKMADRVCRRLAEEMQRVAKIK
jgi:hypothetical protein